METKYNTTFDSITFFNNRKRQIYPDADDMVIVSQVLENAQAALLNRV